MTGMTITGTKEFILSRSRYFIAALLVLSLIFLWPDKTAQIENSMAGERRADDGTLISAIEPVELNSYPSKTTGLSVQVEDAIADDQRQAAVRDQFVRAGELLEQKRFSEASTIYQQLISNFPEIIENHINLAKIFADQNQLEKARITLTDGLTANKKYAVLYANLQKIHGAIAAQAYRQAINKKPESNVKPLNLTSIDTIDTRAVNSDALIRLNNQLVTLKAQQLIDVSRTKELEAQLKQVTQIASQQKELLAQQSTQINEPQKLAVESTVNTEIVVNDASSEFLEVNDVSPANEIKIGPSQELQQRINNEIAEKLVLSWAKAWTEQNVNSYIQHYSNNYRPLSGGLTHQQWLEQRRVRLSNKGFINVNVNDFEVIDMDKKFIVNFTQHYRSNRLNDKIRKQLVFMKINGDDWLKAKIIEENIIKS